MQVNACTMQRNENTKTILVTGFGPFGIHVVNASWEAVKQLNELCADLEALHNVRVITAEIPVVYEYVDNLIPKLWEEHNFAFVIHVGVSAKAECLTLEYQAHSTGYLRPDLTKNVPKEENVDPRVRRTELDVKELCKMVNKRTAKHGCKAVVSHDAGRYLCEYIFHRSLCINPGRTLFVHVPDFFTYTSKQVASGLLDIICLLLKDKDSS